MCSHPINLNMATCDLWMKTHQHFNQVLSDISEKYERNCKKTWRQFELELGNIEKELESCGEWLKSYDLQCQLDFARLEIEIYEDFEKCRHKLRQDTEDAINRTSKYAKYAINTKIVEMSRVQDEIIRIGDEYGVNINNNTCNDELICDSIFIHINQNIIENQNCFNATQISGANINSNNENQMTVKSNDELHDSLSIELELYNNGSHDINNNIFINANNSNNNNNSGNENLINNKFKMTRVKHNMSTKHNDSGIFCNTKNSNNVASSIGDAITNSERCIKNVIVNKTIVDNTNSK